MTPWKASGYCNNTCITGKCPDYLPGFRELPISLHVGLFYSSGNPTNRYKRYCDHKLMLGDRRVSRDFLHQDARSHSKTAPLSEDFRSGIETPLIERRDLSSSQNRGARVRSCFFLFQLFATFVIPGEKNGQKRLISRRKTAKSVSFQAKKHQYKSMSFPAKSTKPGTCHSGPRPGIQGHSRHSRIPACAE